MEDLEIIVEALQKAVKQDVYNKIELKAIQVSLESLNKQLTPEEGGTKETEE